MQDLIVGFIVTACAVYATWVLMPAAWRRGAAGRLARLPLPGPLKAKFQRLSASAPGCGCDGCDSPAPPKRADGAQPVRFIRKTPH